MPGSAGTENHYLGTHIIKVLADVKKDGALTCKQQRKIEFIVLSYVHLNWVYHCCYLHQNCTSQCSAAAAWLARAKPSCLWQEHICSAWHLTVLKHFAVQMLIKLYSSFVRYLNATSRHFGWGTGLPLLWKGIKVWDRVCWVGRQCVGPH